MSEEKNTQTEEMCTLDDAIPRYFKGYDMDILIGKMDNEEPLTEKEWDIIGEAQKIYYGKEYEESHKKIEERFKDEPYIKFVDPCPIGYKQRNNK